MTVTRTVDEDANVYDDLANGVTAGTGITTYRIDWIPGLTGKDVEDALTAEGFTGAQAVLRYDDGDPFLDVTFPFDDTLGEEESPPTPDQSTVIQDAFDAV